MSRSGTFAIFKGKGAAKFTQIPPSRDDKGWVSKNGAVLLEVAPVVGKRDDGLPLCDWEQKITFAISVQDVTQLLDPKTNKIFHKKEDGGNSIVKTLQFTPGQGDYEGTFMMQVSEKSQTQKSISVPFTAGEHKVLMKLLVDSVSMMLGWN
jgi:hypothetical protein